MGLSLFRKGNVVLKRIDGDLTKEEAEHVRDSYKFWYQRIHLGSGVYTMEPGPAFHEMVLEKLKGVFPENIKRASVLDVGTNAGYFPIELK